MKCKRCKDKRAILQKVKIDPDDFPDGGVILISGFHHPISEVPYEPDERAERCLVELGKLCTEYLNSERSGNIIRVEAMDRASDVICEVFDIKNRTAAQSVPFNKDGWDGEGNLEFWSICPDCVADGLEGGYKLFLP